MGALTSQAVYSRSFQSNDRAHAGGTYGGGRKPTEFMCLTLKLLQLQPDKEIVVEYIKDEDYKYVRLLGEHSFPGSWLPALSAELQASDRLLRVSALAACEIWAATR